MKQIALGFFLLCSAAFFLSGCGKVIGVDIPKNQIDQQVKAKFPVTKPGIINLTLAHPVLTFNGAADRIEATTDVTLRLGFVPAKGSVDVDGKLEYHPEDGSIRMGAIRVLKLNVAGLPPGRHEEVIGMIGNMLTPMFKSISLYQFDSKNRLEELARAHLKGFKVNSDSLTVQIAY